MTIAAKLLDINASKLKLSAHSFDMSSFNIFDSDVRIIYVELRKFMSVALYKIAGKKVHITKWLT